MAPSSIAVRAYAWLCRCPGFEEGRSHGAICDVRQSRADYRSGLMRVSQFCTEVAEQAVSGQSELEEMFGVCRVIEVDSVGQAVSQ